MALNGTTNEQKIWNFLIAHGLTPCGAAGLMGNIYAESGLLPNNLQNTGNTKLGMTDAQYTVAVDCGSYTNFAKDGYGYGLCQWTYHTRKAALLAYAKTAGKSVGDLEMQLNFLLKEMGDSYKAVLAALKTTTTVKAASDSVMVNFERPADQSNVAKSKRAAYGQTYYEKFAKEGSTMSFTMRTTKPGAGNKYYIRKASGGYNGAIKGSPTDSECDVLANCVGYAIGRFNEIGGWGSCKYLSPVNAENFIQYKGDLEISQTPQVGACMVWQKGATLSGSDGAGHVAIVEKVVSNTEVYTSESGYGSKAFWNQTRKKGSDGNWGCSASYKFLGFILNPAPCCKSSNASNKSSGTNTTKATVKVEAAKLFDKSIAKTYTVDAASGLHIRAGAGTSKPSLGVLKNGTTARCYGYYNKVGSTIWLYVVSNGITGYVCKDYLK